MDKKINDFVVFCIEIFKKENDLNGKDVYEIFENYGVLKYLQEGYEVLHTQSEGWIINDITEFLNIRGFNKN